MGRMQEAADRLAMSEERAKCNYEGIPFNPKLPERFESTPNDARPESHQRWWGRPFIQTYTPDYSGARDEEEAREKWKQHWPSGVRYDVRCLDGGAWDRSTCWGMFATIDEAIACVLARWRRGRR